MNQRLGMRWEPLAAMVLLLALAVWLLYRPSGGLEGSQMRPGVVLEDLEIGAVRGALEMAVDDAGQWSYRFLTRDGYGSPSITRVELVRLLGERAVTRLEDHSGNAVFRLLNVTGWGSLIWVAIGLGGQVVFSCRFLIQWIVSERRGVSVVPEIFWWLSLAGALLLFTYFVWRRDLVGVLGQTTGCVIYARNLWLLHRPSARRVG